MKSAGVGETVCYAQLRVFHRLGTSIQPHTTCKISLGWVLPILQQAEETIWRQNRFYRCCSHAKWNASPCLGFIASKHLSKMSLEVRVWFTWTTGRSITNQQLICTSSGENTWRGFWPDGTILRQSSANRNAQYFLCIIGQECLPNFLFFPNLIHLINEHANLCIRGDRRERWAHQSVDLIQ